MARIEPRSLLFFLAASLFISCLLLKGFQLFESTLMRFRSDYGLTGSALKSIGMIRATGSVGLIRAALAAGPAADVPLDSVPLLALGSTVGLAAGATVLAGSKLFGVSAGASLF